MSMAFETFKEACVARQLLQTDDEWHNALTEASILSMPVQIRQLFVTIIAFNNPTNPLELWERHCEAMAEDFAREMPEQLAKSAALTVIDQALRRLGTSAEAHALPLPRDFDLLKR